MDNLIYYFCLWIPAFAGMTLYYIEYRGSRIPDISTSILSVYRGQIIHDLTSIQDPAHHTPAPISNT